MRGRRGQGWGREAREREKCALWHACTCVRPHAPARPHHRLPCAGLPGGVLQLPHPVPRLQPHAQGRAHRWGAMQIRAYMRARMAQPLPCCCPPAAATDFATCCATAAATPARPADRRAMSPLPRSGLHPLLPVPAVRHLHHLGSVAMVVVAALVLAVCLQAPPT